MNMLPSEVNNFEPSLPFLDLPWNDILVLHIMPFLDPSDWLSLRIVCKQALQLVNDYIDCLKYLDLSNYPSFPIALWKVINDNFIQ